MQLTEEPDIVTWPETHYVFVEKIGPFQNTAPQAWNELHKLVPVVSEHNAITKYFSLYNMERQVYRAGLGLAAAPSNLPDSLQYEKIKGGKYSRFVLTGPYSNLGHVTGRVFHIVKEKKIPLRADFNIENYANDPRTTPEDQLITEIMFPTV